MSAQLVQHDDGSGAIIVDEKVIGEFRRHAANKYTYQSHLAVGPARSGKCQSLAEALAHMGYKIRKGQKKNNEQSRQDS